ncbi:MAG: hypothetical protein IMF11_09700, partial [Proteobacteria bacterium]|nr:hypothetical protein [Pseudomonadota bacterium]
MAKTFVDTAEKSSVSTDSPSADDGFLQIMRKRLDRSVTNESDEREKGLDDTKFINGDQWEESIKTQRGKNRLCITINKMPTFLDQVDGDIRLNTPGLKIKAVDNDSDPDTADVIEGLVRYIQRSSAANRIHAYAGVHVAAGGRGAWRVLTEYVGDNSFEQEIRVARIINAYSVYFDPAAEQDDKQDGMYMFLITDMSKDEYKEEYGNDPVDFAVDGSEFVNWQTESTVRVAEYFYKEKIEDRTLYLLKNGDVVTKKPKGKAARTRTVPIYKIKWAKVDGKRVLETGDIPGSMFPIILVWGKQLCVDGKLESRGIARHSKDAVRLYNYFRTNDAETAALQPKQPYLMPDVCIGIFKDTWDKSNDENYPYLPYHVDPSYPNHKPYRETPAMASSANREQIQIADDEMRDTIGIQKAALGQESNEQSGVAITKRKQESDTGQYAFLDNLSAGIRTEGQIVVGMIPEIYDTEKQIRILGKDMKEKIVSINDGAGIDLTVGRYDVDISTEGSYSTQREEFQEKLTMLLPHMTPEQIAVTADIYFEMMDFSRADDIAERLKKLIPPEILEADEQGKTMEAGEGGAGLSPEGGGEPPIDPAMEAQMEQLRIENEKGDIELQITQTKLEQEETK